MFLTRFGLVPVGFVNGCGCWSVVGLSLSLFLSCALALLGKLHEACAPAKPPAPAYLCLRTCPFARLLLGVDRGTCWGKGGWGDRGFCDPATIELRVGTIIAIVVQPGRVFGD